MLMISNLGLQARSLAGTDAGSAVTYCVITDNGAGSNDPAMQKADLIETRRIEQINSATVVGVHDVRFLGYSDGTLEHTLDLRRDLTRLVREIRPQIVVTMDPTTIFSPTNDYINHPDHRAAAEATMYATFPSAGSRPIFPELLAEGYEPHDVSKLYLMFTQNPTLHIDTTSTQERKLEALRCHTSQQISEEILEMVSKWGAEAGKEAGFGYAESYRVINLARD